jgi:hypothetical protein
MCSKHVLISIYFNVILEFPVQLYITFSNVVQWMELHTFF